MKRIIYLAMGYGLLLQGCNDNSLTDGSLNTTSNADEELIEVAVTSGQLASGTSYRLSESTEDSVGMDHHMHHRGGRSHYGPGRFLDGISLIAPTEELLTIVDAESASDIRGMRISKNGGATITNYNESGEEVVLSIGAEGPHGCSFSGHQYPVVDSLLATIVKTVIDFGDGVTFTRDSIEITRSGKIIIERGDDGTTRTEVTTFEDYFVNGNQIIGVKIRTSTFDLSTGSGSSVTTVAGGKIIFSDGREANWISEKSRQSDLELDSESGRPLSGTISTEVLVSVITTDGSVIFSHQTTSPLTEDLSCERRRRGPVSGVLKTVYGDDEITIDFGDGSCSNSSITITINGETTTHEIM